MNQFRKFAKEFATEAVALLHNSGRTRRQVADDLGIGLSTLARWSRESRDCVDAKSDASNDDDVVAELKRLRRDNDVLRQERDILKKATVFFRQGGKTMRFALFEHAKEEFPIQRLCKVLGVSQSGCFAYRCRSASKRQHGDMVMLAHVRSAFALSNSTY
jgi:putative transposase